MARTIIRVWLPKLGMSLKDFGHVSLEIEERGCSIIYASFWPAYPQIADRIHRIAKQILHDLNHPEQPARSLIPIYIRDKLGTRDQLATLAKIPSCIPSSTLTSVSPLPMHLLNPEWDMMLESSDDRNPKEPNDTIELSMLNASCIVTAFKLFSNNNYQWNALASTFLKDECMQNCCGLVLALLEAGGIEKFTSFHLNRLEPHNILSVFSLMAGCLAGVFAGRFIYGKTGENIGLLIATSANSFFYARRKPQMKAATYAAVSANIMLCMYVFFTTDFFRPSSTRDSFFPHLLFQLSTACGMFLSRWIGGKIGYYCGMLPEGSGGIVTPKGVASIANYAKYGFKCYLQEMQTNIAQGLNGLSAKDDLEIGSNHRLIESLLNFAENITPLDSDSDHSTSRIIVENLARIPVELREDCQKKILEVFLEEAAKENTPAAQWQRFTYKLTVKIGSMLEQTKQELADKHPKKNHWGCAVM